MKRPSFKIKALLIGAMTLGSVSTASQSLMDLVAKEVPVKHIKVARPSDTTGWGTSVMNDHLQDSVEESLMKMIHGEVQVDTQKVAMPGTDTTGWKSA